MMKQYQIVRSLLTVLCGALLLSACQTNHAPATRTSTAASGTGGHLTIHRAPDLGVGLIIWIDGGSKFALRKGDTYNTDLATGKHTINIIPSPNETNQAASTLALTVENGKTYSFTASRIGDNVALTRDP
jgi:hypothetical protein